MQSMQRERKYSENRSLLWTNETIPGSLPFLGHCWRSALLAAFRLVGFVRTAGQLDPVCWSMAGQFLRVWCYALAGKSILNLCQCMLVSSLLRGPSNEPLENGVQVGLFFRAYAVAGHLPVGHALQVQGVYQLVYREMATHIGLVAEDQEWNAFHGWLLEENVELFLCYWQGLFVG
jgi:hypothetical protein